MASRVQSHSTEYAPSPYSESTVSFLASMNKKSQHTPRSQHGCAHIQFHKTDETLQSLKTLVAYSLRFHSRHYFLNAKSTLHLNLDKLPTPFCHTCHDCCGRLHACLHCVYIGCSSKHSHIHQHLNARNHCFCMDFSHLAVYCSKCLDYIHDYDLEEIINLEKIRMNELISSLLNDYAGRHKIHHFTTWKPSESEMELIRQKSIVSSHLGIRGLRNVGNTCFMNVILQCLIHNPPLRAFFLSDMHNISSCEAKDRMKCLACQMDKLFANFYSGEMSPIIPSEFLWCMWMSCRELVGYAQQDAHEFFIGVLNGLHQSLTEEDRKLGNSDCCIIHSIFSGTFQSTVSCLNCGNQTVANDPFLDISLDVRSVFSPICQSTSVSSTDIKGGSTVGMPNEKHYRPIITSMKPTKVISDRKKIVEKIQTNNLPTREMHTLYECFDRFTHKERLNWTEYKCSKCMENLPVDTSKLGSLKQLSLKKVPLVLALQLKRYDHRVLLLNSNGPSSTQTENGGKLSMNIKFPLDLDLTKWTTRYIQQSPSIKSSLPIPNPSFAYTLFAVIVHVGTLQSGHYFCYVRQSGSTGRWFRFDDHMVCMAEWEEVSQCEAYMLFYIKKNFEYQ